MTAASRGGRVRLVGVELDYAEHGPADGPPLLLIMGLGMQRIAWPDSLLDALAGRGLRCITFDNRDAGHSTRYEAYGAPPIGLSIGARLLRRPLRLPYRLADIADDAAGLLHHLGLPHAHVVGVSMGGMIAQHFAHRHPRMTRSLSLLCSSSGHLGLPLPAGAVLRHLLDRPRRIDQVETAVTYMVRLFRLIGSPGHPMTDSELQARCRRAAERASAGSGMTRQLAAILNDGDRSALLRHLQVPTLVLHGDADPLLPLAHGRDLARKIRGARFERVPGWGHDLPDSLSPALADHIAAHAASTGS